MFEMISMERGDFWISSVNLVKMLKDSGIAEKQHYHVLRDIDRMFEANKRMVSKFGSVAADGSCSGHASDFGCMSEVKSVHKKDASDFGCMSEVKSVHKKDASDFGCMSEVPGMYLSTYSDAYGNDRRCWMLEERRVIQLCAGYSEEVRWYVVEWLHSLHEYYQLREEEDARLLLEYTEKIEAEKKSIEKEIGEVVGREVERFDITVTTLSKCIGSILYELTGEEETVFVPTAHDINVIMWKMGLIGTKKHLGIDKPNPYSVLTKFFVDYPGVAVPKFFNNQIGHNPEICYEAVRLNSGSESFGSFIMDMKSFGIKNNIGLKK